MLPRAIYPIIASYTELSKAGDVTTKFVGRQSDPRILYLESRKNAFSKTRERFKFFLDSLSVFLAC